MKTGTPGFIKERLIQARSARSVPTRHALAGLIGKNASTVSRWEDGSSSPETEALMSLAELLKVRPEFFLRPLSDQENQSVFFRSLASTLKRDIAMQRARMQWLQEVSQVIQHYVDFPSVNIPDIVAGQNYKQFREEDFERIALELRRYWLLGEGPCGNIVEIMERNGFVVASEEMGTSKLDGLCQWSEVEGRPYVLLASDKMSFPRRQMDAAHEIAHAILHRGVSLEQLRLDFKLIEAQAFKLASAFLMPGSSYSAEIRNPSLASLLLLKERWRVSVKAQIKRLQDIGILRDESAARFYKLYSAKGWARGEPLDNHWPLQKPRLLSEALNTIVEAGVRTKADLLSCEFAISAADIEQLTSLPNGWFSREPADIIRLDKLKSREPDRGSRDGLGGMIVKFPH